MVKEQKRNILAPVSPFFGGGRGRSPLFGGSLPTSYCNQASSIAKTIAISYCKAGALHQRDDAAKDATPNGDTDDQVVQRHIDRSLSVVEISNLLKIRFLYCATNDVFSYNVYNQTYNEI